MHYDLVVNTGTLEYEAAAGVIVEALRTPIGRARKGSLVEKDAFALAQVVVAAVLERTEIEPDEIDDLMMKLE